MSALPSQRWPDPSPMRRDPTEAEIEPVAKSILAYLLRNPNVWHEAVSDLMAHGQCGLVGMVLRDGDTAEAGRLIHVSALTKITDDARDLAERSFYDNFTAWERELLKGWKL